MKLLGDLCELISCEPTQKGFEAKVRLNPSHYIFAGHFPGHPVTPGVIQMQLVQELVAHYLKKPVSLVELDQCKFIKVLDPQRTPELIFQVNIGDKGDQLLVTATGETNEGTFLKLQGRYRANLT